jgi:2-polyprenyl-3-methyl-5-hydroxy-6-metoxy-1,4-benzoquinol methylase
MKLIPCNNCDSIEYQCLFFKKSNLGEEFKLVQCKNCKLVFVNPQPSFEQVSKYYSDEYFTKRSDRGYDNYYSEKIRFEIERVFQLNLLDLEFFSWEKTLPSEKSTLDIGCAAGYFVAYMQSRSWEAKGIEIAEGPIRFGREVLKQSIIQNDFLDWDKSHSEKFTLITLWASIEHLHKPKETLEKIYTHLLPNGRMILSTCRYGILAKFNGLNWRFLNVPEHLFYYSRNTIVSQCESIGFKLVKQISYGSGMTSKKNGGVLFRLSKKFFDWFVKFTNQGDMIALVFEKAVP